MSPQSTYGRVRHDERSPTALRLRLKELQPATADALQRVVHVDRARLEVYVLPAEGERLTFGQAERERDRVERRKPILRGDLEETACLRDREITRLVLRHSWSIGKRGDVP